MTVYADYEVYTNDYLCGRSAAVTAVDFPYYARAASAEIDRYTFGNIPADIPEEVKLCCCELSELLHAEDSTTHKPADGVTSETVGGWSQSYESSQARTEAHKTAVSDVLRRWLSSTGLLYSGV